MHNIENDKNVSSVMFGLYIVYENISGKQVFSKVYHRRGHGGSERVQSYSWTLSSTSVLDGVGGQRQASGALHPAKRSLGQGAGKSPGPH